MFCALSVFALASYLFTSLSLEWPVSWIVWLVALRFGCGSFVYAPMTATALSQLSPEKVRMGSGLLNLMQNGLGNTLGLAMVTTVLQRRLTYHSSALDQQQAFSALSWGEILPPVRALVHQAGVLGQLGEEQVQMLVQRISNSRQPLQPIRIASCWSRSCVSPVCPCCCSCGGHVREL